MSNKQCNLSYRYFVRPDKQFCRNPKRRWLTGVIAGIAEYYEVSPTGLRLLYIIATFMTGLFPLLFLYVVLYTIMAKGYKEDNLINQLKEKGLTEESALSRDLMALDQRLSKVESLVHPSE